MWWRQISINFYKFHYSLRCAMPNISSKYQKDFKNLDYKNPRVARDESRRCRQRNKLILVAVALTCVGLMYFLFFSPVFAIKQVSVSGLNKIETANIHKIIDAFRSDRVFFIFSRNNFWLFNQSALSRLVGQSYYLDKLEVKRIFPNKISVMIKERSAVVNWTVGGACLHLDNTGTAIEFCDSTPGLPNVFDSTNATYTIGQTVIAVEALQKMLAINDAAQIAVNKKLNATNYVLEQTTLTLQTKEGVAVRFNMNLTAEEQGRRLAILLGSPEVNANLKTMKYIDLRFGEKIFYQ